MAVTAARISVLFTTAVPAGVTGAVAPRMGIGYSITGMPAVASVNASSMPKRSWWSGLTVQRIAEKVGRARSSAAPPATAFAMRIRGSASAASLRLTTMVCLREARRQASNSCSTRDSGGASCADTRAEVAERLARPSTTRAAS